MVVDLVADDDGNGSNCEYAEVTDAKSRELEGFNFVFHGVSFVRWVSL